MGNRESFKRPREKTEVWKDAMDLVGAIYRFSAPFPETERFGLTAQIRRAAVSIAPNVAEGAARRSRPEYLRFLSIARGSLAELDTQRLIASRLGYGEPPVSPDKLVDRLFAKLTSLMNTLAKRGNSQ